MAGYVSPARKELQKKANIFVVLGIVLSIATRVGMSMAKESLNRQAAGGYGLAMVAPLVRG